MNEFDARVLLAFYRAASKLKTNHHISPLDWSYLPSNLVAHGNEWFGEGWAGKVQVSAGGWSIFPMLSMSFGRLSKQGFVIRESTHLETTSQGAWRLTHEGMMMAETLEGMEHHASI